MAVKYAKGRKPIVLVTSKQGSLAEMGGQASAPATDRTHPKMMMRRSLLFNISVYLNNYYAINLRVIFFLSDDFPGHTYVDAMAAVKVPMVYKTALQTDSKSGKCHFFALNTFQIIALGTPSIPIFERS